MILDTIKNRQSTRSFLTKQIPRETIDQCLKAAQLAPSACNAQPWHFIVLNDPDLKNQLCDKIFNGPYAVNAFAKQAPVIIVVVCGINSLMTKIGGFLRKTPFYLIDVGIAVEHFILAACEKDLSSCWIGWFNEKEAKKFFKIPNNKKIPCIIPLGYTSESHREKIRKPLGEIVSYNEYKEKKRDPLA